MDNELNKVFINELNGIDLTSQRKLSQSFQFESFKNILDKLILNAESALNSKDYLELMKIAISIKTKARMLKNNNIPEDIKNLLQIAEELEKKAKNINP